MSFSKLLAEVKHFFLHLQAVFIVMAAPEGAASTSEKLQVHNEKAQQVDLYLQPPFERYTLVELRWWLLCRGQTVPATMKKGKMIEK